MTFAPSGKLAAFGRVFFGLPMVAFGVVHFLYGDFVTRFAPGWPSWAPGRSILARVVGALLIAAGLSIVFEKGARMAALSVATMFALLLVFLYVPKIAANPGHGGTWTAPAKYLALFGGALLVAGLYPHRGGPIGSGASSAEPIRVHLFLGRILLGVFLTLCGGQHFVYLSFVATLVPAWISEHVFWARFAGVALIAGGVGLWIRQTVRLAALLSGTMIFIWFLRHWER